MDNNRAADKEHSHCSLQGVRTQADTVDIPDKRDTPLSAVHTPAKMTAAREMEPEMAHIPAAVARELFQEDMEDIPVVVSGSLERRDRVHSRAETAAPLTDEKATHPSHALDARIVDRQD